MGSDPRDMNAEQKAGARPSRDDPGGDSACWLSRVCPTCGRINDGPDEACTYCESAVDAHLTWATVCEFRDLPAGIPMAVNVDGDAICLVHAGGEVYAVHDECTHAAVPLSVGEVDGATIECGMHGSRFDLRTGAALNLPATGPVRTYPVRVLDGHVQAWRS
jgi:3-phenylpropionate/trans-cinnamate dioxygenase ferredoxin subunit